MKMINPGTILQDRYLIEKQIGEGGMGAVYLAVDQRFDNHVAIKVTFYNDNEFGEAFEREAKILNGLLHPVLPHVSDYFTEGDEHFLVMQYIEGEDAYDVLKREGAFSVKDVLRWTDNLLDALDYLHSQEPPIIHRDLKPTNLKITPRGDIFLLDFGLAKLKKENTLSERSVFGYSRKYSPLEQIQGTGTDARSDIFALAATVYHLITGSPPIDAIARASAIVAGRTDPIEPASEKNEEIPSGVANVLHIALALNAENRFASAKAMRQALKHAVQGTAWENIEALPEAPTIIVAEAEPQIINIAENENFPALTAFAESLEAPLETEENIDPPREAVEPPTAGEITGKTAEVLPSAAPEQGKLLSYAEAIAQAVKPIFSPAEPDNTRESSQKEDAATRSEVKNLTYAEAIRQALNREAASKREDVVENPAPEAVSPAVSAENNLPDSVEKQDFPLGDSPENQALPFVAETLDTPAETIDHRPLSDEEIQPGIVPNSAPPESYKSAESTEFDTPTVVAPRRRRSAIPVVAVIALLAIFAAGSALFLLKNRQQVESGQSSPETNISETQPDPAENETVPAEAVQTAEPDATSAENNEKIKTKSAPVKKESAPPPIEEATVTEETGAETSHSRTAPTTAKRTAPRAKTPRIEKRENEVRSDPIPDIESIFTGRPSWEREERMRRREERRRMREQMTEEEWREWRRQRRQQRRQNSYPIPF